MWKCPPENQNVLSSTTLVLGVPRCFFQPGANTEMWKRCTPLYFLFSLFFFWGQLQFCFQFLFASNLLYLLLSTKACVNFYPSSLRFSFCRVSWFAICIVSFIGVSDAGLKIDSALTGNINLKYKLWCCATYGFLALPPPTQQRVIYIFLPVSKSDTFINRLL